MSIKKIVWTGKGFCLHIVSEEYGSSEERIAELYRSSRNHVIPPIITTGTVNLLGCYGFDVIEFEMPGKIDFGPDGIKALMPEVDILVFINKNAEGKHFTTGPYLLVKSLEDMDG